MWEEVFRCFKSEAGELSKEDNDLYSEIRDFCNKASFKSEPEVVHQSEIENALGEGSHIILIKYGLTQDELLFNASRIISIEQFLEDEDNLLVDITHSFRSLPLMLMNALIYLQNVSKKKIQIKHITYGMLDVTSEMSGITPVVELNDILRLSDWISGAHAFADYGNAYTIANLMEGENKSAAKRLKKFSDEMNLNHIYSIQQESSNLAALKDMQYKTPFPAMIFNPVIENFTNAFQNSMSHSKFQYTLAKWQYEHKNYCASYITLSEAILTYVCEQKCLDPENHDDRDYAKDVLWNSNNQDNEYYALNKIYKSVIKTRNALAHSLKNGQNYIQMIDNLGNNLNKLQTIIK
jgi:CRISPR-associated Csx2 family protein